jgi:hypothetical protein
MAASDEGSLLSSLSKYTLKKVSQFSRRQPEAAAAATAVRRGATTSAGSTVDQLPTNLTNTQANLKNN